MDPFYSSFAILLITGIESRVRSRLLIRMENPEWPNCSSNYSEGNSRSYKKRRLQSLDVIQKGSEVKVMKLNVKTGALIGVLMGAAVRGRLQ
jgi:hypothetical protein